MKILSIIPARSGSKGLKNKNMKKFLNKPLISHTLEFSKKLPGITTFVSTDSIEILNYVKKKGIKFNYLRPKYLSRDKSKVEDIILHALNWFANKNIFFDYFLLLQPTSPLRSLSEVIKIIKLVKKKEIKSLVTVTEMSEHPYECIKINKKNKWAYLASKNFDYQYLRQNYDKKFFFIDGSIYLIRVDFFKKNKIIVTPDYTYIYKSKFKRQVDINTFQDFKMAEALFKINN
jgi:CMP-N,N'-diacetyllegionaminic acid synthase